MQITDSSWSKNADETGFITVLRSSPDEWHREVHEAAPITSVGVFEADTRQVDKSALGTPRRTRSTSEPTAVTLQARRGAVTSVSDRGSVCGGFGHEAEV
jgi:hypothetical protein